jgi:hypothetical protein
VEVGTQMQHSVARARARAPVGHSEEGCHAAVGARVVGKWLAWACGVVEQLSSCCTAGLVAKVPLSGLSALFHSLQALLW